MPKQLVFGADFHLGAFQYGRTIREEDYQRAFDAFFDNAIALPDTDLVLLGDVGDIAFERRGVLARITGAIHRAAASRRTVYYIGGNHDGDEVSLPEAVKHTCFVDAEKAFFAALAAGVPFQPYGADGPRVAALHGRSREELWKKLNEIREAEKPENRSTELWLHQAIAPGAKTMFAEFNAVDFINQGWVTVLAGDIHNGGVWSVTAANSVTGLLIYPGSPEMTDINEVQRRRGFVLHRPTSDEAAPNPNSFAQIPYQHRPYMTFEFPAERTPEQEAKVLAWADEATRATGLKPIIRICSTNKTWRNDGAIQRVCVKLLFNRPECLEHEMVPTAPAELTADGQIAGGNATRYGRGTGPGTIYQKLQRVLAASDLPPEVKDLGDVVLSHPGNTAKWLEAAHAA